MTLKAAQSVVATEALVDSVIRNYRAGRRLRGGGA